MASASELEYESFSMSASNRSSLSDQDWSNTEGFGCRDVGSRDASPVAGRGGLKDLVARNGRRFWEVTAFSDVAGLIEVLPGRVHERQNKGERDWLPCCVIVGFCEIG